MNDGLFEKLSPYVARPVVFLHDIMWPIEIWMGMSDTG